jgi:hypothetical protein
MLKYMSTIKNIYEMKGNESFRYYDETFRVTCAIGICVKKGLNPSIVWVNSSTIIVFCCGCRLVVVENCDWRWILTISWTWLSYIVHQFLPATTAKYNNGTAINPNNRRVQPFLDTNTNGTCHIYNKYQCCTEWNCPYQRVCRVCRGSHPQAKCTKQATIHQNVTCAIVIGVKKGLNPSIVWVNSSTIIVFCCDWWLLKIVIGGEFWRFHEHGFPI